MIYRLITDAALDRIVGIAEQAIDTYPDSYVASDRAAMLAARTARQMVPPERIVAVRAALCMEGDESSFAHALGTLFLAADGDNKARLLAAFGDVFAKFGEGA